MDSSMNRNSVRFQQGDKIKRELHRLLEREGYHDIPFISVLRKNSRYHFVGHPALEDGKDTIWTISKEERNKLLEDLASGKIIVRPGPRRAGSGSEDGDSPVASRTQELPHKRRRTSSTVLPGDYEPGSSAAGSSYHSPVHYAASNHSSLSPERHLPPLPQQHRHSYSGNWTGLENTMKSSFGHMLSEIKTCYNSLEEKCYTQEMEIEKLRLHEEKLNNAGEAPGLQDVLRERIMTLERDNDSLQKRLFDMTKERDAARKEAKAWESIVQIRRI